VTSSENLSLIELLTAREIATRIAQAEGWSGDRLAKRADELMARGVKVHDALAEHDTRPQPRPLGPQPHEIPAKVVEDANYVFLHTEEGPSPLQTVTVDAYAAYQCVWSAALSYERVPAAVTDDMVEAAVDWARVNGIGFTPAVLRAIIIAALAAAKK
jgi:hypothetical protein